MKVEAVDPALAAKVKAHGRAADSRCDHDPEQEPRVRSGWIKSWPRPCEKLKNPDVPTTERHVKIVFHGLEYTEVRNMILEKRSRADGRGPADIRPITCEVGSVAPRARVRIFTRGETQSLAVVTLGTTDDEQRIDALEGEYIRTFMLHYNFPPFSVGEARPLRTPGRREVGHGALAERALSRSFPGKTSFPIRSVSCLKFWSPTDRRRWRPSAAEPWRCWMPAFRSRSRWRVSRWA